MDLRDKVALVTGGARRIGRAIALALAERGADVVVHCRRSVEEAEQTLAQVRRLGRKGRVVVADQRDWSAVERACDEAWESMGGIDVLVNSAAVYRRTPLAETTESDWDELLGTNLKGPFAFARFLGPRMKARGRGKIVNIADVAAMRAWPGYIPYSISKAGVVAATVGLAKALAPEVQVNAVAPGVILWPEGLDEERKGEILGTVPLGREGSPADVARAVCFLIESGDYITGVVLAVDGGRAIW